MSLPDRGQLEQEPRDVYRSLAHPGLEAATDPDSQWGRFARPIAWPITIAIVALATFLLFEALGRSTLGGASRRPAARHRPAVAGCAA